MSNDMHEIKLYIDVGSGAECIEYFAGAAIALMAMVLDRMTHAMAQRFQPPTGH